VTETFCPADISAIPELSADANAFGVTGYEAAVDIYWNLGWTGALPYRAGTKVPPPTGFTGYGGEYPSYADICEWKSQYTNGNIGIRVPDTVVGIDVDAYVGKDGAPKQGSACLAEAEHRWGQLPSAPMSTSRGDGVSGIRWFRVKPGTKLKTIVSFRGMGIDGGIEIVQWFHRYAIVWPSFHPETGEQYRWERDGQVLDVPPRPDEVPELPQTWADGLRDDSVARVAFGPDGPYGVVQALTEGEPSDSVTRRLTAALGAVNGSSRHDNTRNNALALLIMGKGGHPGVKKAIETLGEVFAKKVGPDRGHDVAVGEFESFIYGKRVPQLLSEPLIDGNGGFFLTGGPPPPKDSDIMDNNLKPASTIGGPGRRLTLLSANDISDDIPDWVWDVNRVGRIQRGVLSLFAGRPGAGKSTAARWFAAGWTRGDLEGIWYRKPQNVAYIASEESLRYVVKPGLRAAGADMARIVFPEVTFDGQAAPLIADEDEQRLTEQLKTAGVTVVIVDPVMSTIEKKVDIYRNNELRAALAPWVRIAETVNGTVGGIVHLKKGNNSDVVGAVNGSSAFGEVARCVFGFVKDPDDVEGSRVMSQVKNSCGPEDLSRKYKVTGVEVTTDSGRRGAMPLFVMGEDSDVSVEDIMSGGAGGAGNAGGRKVSAEAQKVVDLVNNREGGTWPEVLVDADLAADTKTASNMLRRAANRGLIANPSRGFYTRNTAPQPGEKGA
jgi:AAA domain/Bifunctional DNA primase/polymerase, N-terminal